MKVLVGRFSSESNEHSRSLMSLDKFILKYGEDCIDSMYCRDIFEENGKAEQQLEQKSEKKTSLLRKLDEKKKECAERDAKQQAVKKKRNHEMSL